MRTGWVAGSVRAKALARRRLGTAAVRTLARSGSFAEAVQALAGSPYGQHVTLETGLAEAQRAVTAEVLWNMRVLAGWLPAEGARALRVLAGWFEIANVEEHLRMLAGRTSQPPYRMGVLASAWPRLATATSAPQLREALAASVWGDPGGHTASEIGTSMRATWAQRVADQVKPARAWAAGAVALLIAGQRLVGQRRLPQRAVQSVDRLLGQGWSEANSLAALREVLPANARWALQGVERPDQLWRAEARWWARVRTDALTLVGGSGFGLARPVGAIALLAVDAWQVQAALEFAARPVIRGVDFDVVA
jgi:hypothetical protein